MAFRIISGVTGILLNLIPVALYMALSSVTPGVSIPISETLFAPNGPVGS